MSEVLHQSGAALSLPFDQYQRYTTAARIVEALGGADGRSILEVGGAPGFLEEFFPQSRLVIVDRYGTHPGTYLVADGARLPFADESFDVVVTLDTLEHVHATDRPAFLAECRRVSRDLVVLSAPHGTEAVELAEAALQAFVTARFGEVFGTLKEHSDNGLPRAEETQRCLSEDGWSAARLPSGYLPRWLLGMLFHHELLAVGLPELPELHAFYNRTVASHDNREPSYRQVFVASRVRSGAELDAVVEELRSGEEAPGATAALAAIASSVLARRLPNIDPEVVPLRARCADLEQRLAQAEVTRIEAEKTLAVENVRIEELQARLTAVHDEFRDMQAALASRSLPGLLRKVARRKP